MNSYILIGIESFIDHIGCIRDLGIAYWKKANKKMLVGDIVYLFISDKKYWHGIYKHDNCCFKLKNIGPVYHGDGLDRNELEEHGISRYVQYKRLTDEQAEWLASHFIFI